ncbi:ABC transporter substrate-binding protein [Herbiconiux sp. CPCC 203407]|uniref:ABC transporter substrate-binding protein n=1 Tax=Herbiconiux oxytropis TaxID=2970915 RepID=A0AA42BV80_9MICO|nr:ABC transporter substrate-binding protein [Herbiconiux oxytropis]MCS5723634.1 ABC transporter substrate-binding protein [Herbiconiux oxytropis]MCS5726951.1 ABC transporter substrate-binding protein [Herbiconiux oxytropis]
MSTARLKTFGALATAAALVAGLAACSSDAAATDDAAASGSVTVGAFSNGAATETEIDVETVDSIRDTLPQEVLDSGELTIGIGALPAGFPPLAFVGDDNETFTGAEPDLGRLVAAVLGLEPVVSNATWENLFVGIDSGATDVGLSNITVTEERKEKYDFASYRGDNLAFQVLASNDWEFDDDYENLDGLTVATSRGTNQEKILLEWKSKLEAEGKTLEVVYFPDANSVTLALGSGQIDAQFNPNPTIAYQNTLSAESANPTRSAGVVSGAGESLDGLIAATVKKDSGLAQPIADAINHLIENGQYAEWLEAWGLSDETVTESLVNPPGLPRDNS